MDGFLGEIRMFAGNYAPQGWALCDGSLLPISGNEALFSLLGTSYGGDGVSQFALPDLRGRAPIGQGTGPGLSARALGEKLGEETHCLGTAEMPAHTHAVQSGGAASSSVPKGMEAGATSFNLYAPALTAPGTLAADAVTPAGEGRSHSNMMPTTCINFIICQSGIYPSRD